MANINAILSGGKRERNTAAGSGYTIKMIHYSKLLPSKKQNREERNIEELADLLELSGEIKQPLLVRKALGDKYEVIAGHRRRLAAIYNVEEKGLKEFEFLPCKIETVDEIDAEISLITTNTGFDTLTDLEQVNAVMRLKELLPRKEKNGDLKGRELRKRIAETLNKSATKIGQLEHIGNNLSETGKHALATGKINVSTADALASLPAEKQEQLLQKPGLKVKDVKQSSQKPDTKAEQAETEEDTVIDADCPKEENVTDESWETGDLPQAEGKYLKHLARILVDAYGTRMAITIDGKTAVSDEIIKNRVQRLEQERGGCIDIGEGVSAFASAMIIEFLRGEEDIGTCTYERFAVQVRKTMDTCELPGKCGDEIQRKPEEGCRTAAAPEVSGLKMPVMKNKGQRKEFLDTFHEWPVWFRVPEASEVYYRYDLPDGYSLVTCEYNSFCEWMAKYKDMNPEKVYQRHYLLKPGYHYLHDCQSNRTALEEHLKEMQKEGRGE